MTDELTTEARSKLELYGMIFADMMQSVRFQNFINTNFDIQQAVDEETKEVIVRVVEVPPEVVAERIRELAEAQKPPEEPKYQKVGKKTIVKSTAVTPAVDLAKKVKEKALKSAAQIEQEKSLDAKKIIF